MNYNDEKTVLTQNDWQEMAREYEQTLKTLNTLPNEITSELNSMFHLLLTSFPNLDELRELDVAIKEFVDADSLKEDKRNFFSTPLSTINRRIFEISSKLIQAITSSNFNSIKRILVALFNVGNKINESRRNKW